MSSTLVCTCRTALRSQSSISLAPASHAVARQLHAPASVEVKSRVPKPREPLSSPSLLLAASKRNLSQYESKLGTWEDLFSVTGGELAEKGLSVPDRRYLLWLLEKYRQGEDIEKIATPPTPKKKIRGWGPKVQLGKRIR